MIEDKKYTKEDVIEILIIQADYDYLYFRYSGADEEERGEFKDSFLRLRTRMDKYKEFFTGTLRELNIAIKGLEKKVSN